MSKYKLGVAKDLYNTVSRKREMRQMMLPIFSYDKNSFQMDTMFNHRTEKKTRYYLMLININTRKGYAYKMKTKDTNSVIEVLSKMIDIDRVKISSLYTDEDTAYTSQAMIRFLKEHQIALHTTDESHKHNNLALINRFIRTIRDMNGNNENEYDIKPETMTKLVDCYNSTVHSATGFAPNEMEEDDIDDFIEEKQNYTDIKKAIFHLDTEEKVRPVMKYKPFEKRRYNLAREYLKVDSKQGSSYLLKAEDQSVSEYPRWMLSTYLSEAKPMKSVGRRQIIDKILSYDAKKKLYHVLWEDKTTTWETPRNLRQSNPTELSHVEEIYWGKQQNMGKNIPKNILEYL
jgi:transposase InsO family protein